MNHPYLYSHWSTQPTTSQAGTDSTYGPQTVLPDRIHPRHPSPGTPDERLVVGPKSIRDCWTTFNETDFGRVDTVVPVQGHRDQLYVFFGGRYLEIKIDDNPNDNSVNGGARTIPSGWKSLEKVGFDIVDAAVVVPGNTNQLYFFELKVCPCGHLHG